MSSLGDTLNYLAFNNPISKTTLSGLDKLIQATVSYTFLLFCAEEKRVLCVFLMRIFFFIEGHF